MFDTAYITMLHGTVLDEDDDVSFETDNKLFVMLRWPVVQLYELVRP